MQKNEADEDITSEAGDVRCGASESGEKRKKFNWTYIIEETRYKLAIFEDPQIMTVALRHIIRRMHENGDKITFPIPDAVDRISNIICRLNRDNCWYWWMGSSNAGTKT